MAVLSHSTSYHSSLGFDPNRVFHGRVSCNVVGLQYGLKRQHEALTSNEVTDGVLQQTKQNVNQTQQSLMQSYIRYKHYYDKKASAW